MEKARQEAVLKQLKKTRSHILNALDGVNEKSNVIKDIDRFQNDLENKPLNQISEKDVDYNFDIITREINCSLNCFTHALKTIQNGTKLL